MIIINNEHKTTISTILRLIGGLSIASGILIIAGSFQTIGIYIGIPWLVSGLISGVLFFAIAKVIDLLNSINENLKYNYEFEETKMTDDINSLNEDSVFPENDGFAAEKK